MGLHHLQMEFVILPSSGILILALRYKVSWLIFISGGTELGMVRLQHQCFAWLSKIWRSALWLGKSKVHSSGFPDCSFFDDAMMQNIPYKNEAKCETITLPNDYFTKRFTKKSWEGKRILHRYTQVIEANFFYLAPAPAGCLVSAFFPFFTLPVRQSKVRCSSAWNRKVFTEFISFCRYFNLVRFGDVSRRTDDRHSMLHAPCPEPDNVLKPHALSDQPTVTKLCLDNSSKWSSPVQYIIFIISSAQWLLFSITKQPHEILCCTPDTTSID